jgi:hypothetical protein
VGTLADLLEEDGMKSLWVKSVAAAAFAGVMAFGATAMAKPGDHMRSFAPQAQQGSQHNTMMLRGDSASMQRSMDNTHQSKGNEGNHLPALNPRTHMPAK